MSSQAEPRAPWSLAEWNLLVELPELVAIAATSAEADTARRTVDEGLAADRGIEAGRHSDSALVRAVADELWTDDEPPGGEPKPTAIEFNERRKGLAETLDKARHAAAEMAGRATPEDAAAYRDWLLDIAQQVCEAAKTGGFLGIGGVQVTEREQRFLTDLKAALTT